MPEGRGIRHLLPQSAYSLVAVLGGFLFAPPTSAGEPATALPPPEDVGTVAAVRAALAAGNCAGALETATQRSTVAPQDAVAHRLRGDALRCLGRPRDAILAYQQAVQLGATDPLLVQLIAQVSRSLVTVQVSVGSYESAFPPSVVVSGQGFEPENRVVASGRASFADLPPNVPLVLRLDGAGFAAETVQVPPQAPGSATSYTLGAAFSGVGTVMLDPWSDWLNVSLSDARGVLSGIHPGTVPVTAGPVVLKVSGPAGETSSTVTVARNATVEINPTSFAPSQVTLVKVPAGAAITCRPSDGGPDKELRTGWNDPGTEVDPQTGVPVIAAIPLQGLHSGAYTLRMSQPWLGTVSDEFFAVGGEVGAFQVPWQSMPGASYVQEAYTDWKAKAAAASRPSPHLKLGRIGIAVTSAGTAALAGGLIEGFRMVSKVAQLTTEYNNAIALGNIEEAQTYYNSRASFQRIRTWSWVVAATGSALAAGGLTFTIHSYKAAKSEHVVVPPWDIRNLSPILPAHSPATGGVQP